MASRDAPVITGQKAAFGALTVGVPHGYTSS